MTDRLASRAERGGWEGGWGTAQCLKGCLVSKIPSILAFSSTPKKAQVRMRMMIKQERKKGCRAAIDSQSGAVAKFDSNVSQIRRKGR